MMPDIQTQLEQLRVLLESVKAKIEQLQQSDAFARGARAK